MCALSEGRSVASTMGFSALDGLAMGTADHLDPALARELIPTILLFIVARPTL